jgi:LPS export ABC transporter permease LptG/LPS export ABC transporter permease LptF
MGPDSVMLRTIDRYVIREVIPPFLLSLLIFTFLLEIPPVMRELETLVAKGVSWQIAGRIIITLLPQGLGLTIPMALLTGILIGLGRLSADREAVALLACGVSPYRLLRPIMLMAVIAAGATTYVMIKAIPDANQTFREITFDVITKRVENDIRPRVFFEDFPGWVLYVRDEPTDGRGWKDVLVADTRKPDAPELFLASRGRLILNRAQRRVDLVLTDGTRYSTTTPGETATYRFPGDLTTALNPDAVFQRAELPRGLTEKTIAELREDIVTKLGATVPLSPHPEIAQIHLKYSIPVACIVFGWIGLALGLTVARDSKLAGFVVGVAVIFAYYIVMFLAYSQTQGHYRTIEVAGGLNTTSFLNAHLSRWWPNIVLGIFGLAALVWRARYAERSLPISLPIGIPHLPTRWSTGSDSPRSRPQDPADRSRGTGPRRPLVVVRIPRLRLPGPGILDRYVARLYMRIVALSILALLGLFYISTFLDVSDKVFKQSATAALVVQLLVYKTPQFVYFVVPISALLSALVAFGTLSRTSELTVMKACGISLYRIAVPVVLFSLVWSAALFALDQDILPRANRIADALDNTIRGRPPRTFSPLNRQWLIGRDGSIYHYRYFDAPTNTLNSLTVYRIAPHEWRLASQAFASTAVFRGSWTAAKGWTQEFAAGSPKWRPFDQQPLSLEPPDYFKSEQAETEMMTVLQLRKSVEELAASGFNFLPQAVELQRKLAFPFVTVVMTLLAIPFGVSTGRRGALYGVGLGIVIALSYWIGMNVFMAVGKAGLLSPVLAAWTPNIIVSACAVYLLLTTKT